MAFSTGAVVLDDAALAVARAELTAATRHFDAACEYGDDNDMTSANARLELAKKAMTDAAIPSALRARRFSNALVQDAENRAVEARAIATARVYNSGISYLPCWFVEGIDDSVEMIAWPNGEIQDADSYENEKRLQRLAANPWL